MSNELRIKLIIINGGLAIVNAIFCALTGSWFNALCAGVCLGGMIALIYGAKK